LYTRFEYNEPIEGKKRREKEEGCAANGGFRRTERTLVNLESAYQFP
jgi:hypothetical protein